MDYRLTWDETKRRTNLLKHGLDFADVAVVLESQFRMDTTLLRNGELRVQSVSYALGFLAVLTVVHTERGDETRVISFRRASREERETYYAWLEEDQ